MIRTLKYSLVILLIFAYGHVEDNTMIIFQDGSVVYLKANSDLTFFTNDPRKAELVGEASFEIVNSPVPFIVYIKLKESVAKMNSGAFTVRKTYVYVATGRLEVMPYSLYQKELEQAKTKRMAALWQ